MRRPRLQSYPFGTLPGASCVVYPQFLRGLNFGFSGDELRKRETTLNMTLPDRSNLVTVILRHRLIPPQFTHPQTRARGLIQTRSPVQTHDVDIVAKKFVAQKKAIVVKSNAVWVMWCATIITALDLSDTAVVFMQFPFRLGTFLVGSIQVHAPMAQRFTVMKVRGCSLGTMCSFCKRTQEKVIQIA